MINWQHYCVCCKGPAWDASLEIQSCNRNQSNDRYTCGGIFLWSRQKLEFRNLNWIMLLELYFYKVFQNFYRHTFFTGENLYLRMVIIKSSESITCGVGNDKTINDRRPYHLPIWWPRGKKSLLRELKKTFKKMLFSRF